MPGIGLYKNEIRIEGLSALPFFTHITSLLGPLLTLKPSNATGKMNTAFTTNCFEQVKADGQLEARVKPALLNRLLFTY